MCLLLLLLFPEDPLGLQGIMGEKIESVFLALCGMICSSSRCLIRRGNADTPEGPRDTSPNSETSTSTTHSVCGEQGQA
jgi:hypothetical protein